MISTLTITKFNMAESLLLSNNFIRGILIAESHEIHTALNESTISYDEKIKLVMFHLDNACTILNNNINDAALFNNMITNFVIHHSGNILLLDDCYAYIKRNKLEDVFIMWLMSTETIKTFYTIMNRLKDTYGQLIFFVYELRHLQKHKATIEKLIKTTSFVKTLDFYKTSLFNKLS